MDLTLFFVFFSFLKSNNQQQNVYFSNQPLMALKLVKLKYHTVNLQEILSKVFYCQIARGKWENGAKN